jgi:hypothetical protein
MCSYTRKLPGDWISGETKEKIRNAVAAAGGHNPPHFHRSWTPPGVSVTIKSANCDCDQRQLYDDAWANLVFGPVFG